MTEAEWLAETDDPYRMLNYLGRRVSSRKARLLACACFRRRKPKLRKWEQQTVEVAERYADGQASPEEMQQAQDDSVGKSGVVWVTMDMDMDYCTAVEAARCAGEWRDEPGQCSLVRDLFGNPFRPLPPKKGKRQWNDKLAVWLNWNDGTVVKLAQALYDDRAFDRLPILADALEDAGCTHAEVLAHCRGAGPHARGCWVVDLLLGRE
jgi:hypothetical protein